MVGTIGKNDPRDWELLYDPDFRDGSGAMIRQFLRTGLFARVKADPNFVRVA